MSVGCGELTPIALLRRILARFNFGGHCRPFFDQLQRSLRRRNPTLMITCSLVRWQPETDNFGVAVGDMSRRYRAGAHERVVWLRGRVPHSSSLARAPVWAIPGSSTGGWNMTAGDLAVIYVTSAVRKRACCRLSSSSSCFLRLMRGIHFVAS